MAGKYPVDEFDIAARQRTTRGAHRKRESSAKWWIALIAILILAPALGYGIVKMNQISVAPPSHKPSVSAPAQPSATAPRKLRRPCAKLESMTAITDTSSIP
ncbi:hypothetical protein R6H00_04470, partial [Actinotignum timonense]|nr:hypothetical protein [Actinotignum timonense]